MHRNRLIGQCVFLAGWFLLAAVGYAMEPVVYSPHAAHFSAHMNMGPTGAAAWMRGYHFQIVSIAQGSPAAGRLQFGDLVIGANGVLFGAETGHRKALGHAIAEAEAGGMPLLLHVVRGGQQHIVAIPLASHAPFAAGWPYACAASDAILEAACRGVQHAQQPNGRIVSSGNMGTTWGGLLLLASANPVYLDAARRAAYQVAATEYANVDLNNWSMGHGGILLAEYYLATGDTSVLAALAGMAEELARGQMKSGSWGHKSPGEGYGNLNQPAVACAIALVLAKECGIDVDEAALQKALTFFGRFAQTGNIPYGDHMPGNHPDNNGTSAAAAILMRLAGREEDAKAFARSVALSHWARELGHTGGFWSMAWGPLGAAVAGPQALQTFMAEQAWYYNLSRTWQGGFVLLPYFEALTRFDTSNYIESGPDFTTGGLALAFALPRKPLRILGAAKSVFSPHADLNPSLRASRDLYLSRDWEALDLALAETDPAMLDTTNDRRAYQQLKDARSALVASVDHTIMEIESHLDNRHGFLASQQFEALQRVLGEKGDQRFASLVERFSDGNVDWNVREGKRFWDAWEALKGVSLMGWTAQGRWARDLLEPMPSLRPPVWEPLSGTVQQGPQPWRTMLLGPEESLPASWEQDGFDDSGWVPDERILLAGDQEAASADKRGLVAARREFHVSDPDGVKIRVRLQTVRPAVTQVYLNGTLIVEAVRGQRGGYVFLELDDTALALLKPGQNLLAVTSTAQGKGVNRLDVGLDIARHVPQRAHLRIDRVATVPPVSFDQLDDTQRVREAYDRAVIAFQQSYDGMELEDLLAALEDPVAYIRHVAGNALAHRGHDAIAAGLALAAHADWRVRSEVAHILQKAMHQFQRDAHADEKMVAWLGDQVGILMGMLDDAHFWVRVRAAMALRAYGKQAMDALPALIKLLDDENEWVRLEALRTMDHICDDPAAMVRAAVTTLQHPYSGYPAPRAALRVMQQHAENVDLEAADGLTALLYVIQNPPEGDGRRLLNQAMDMAATLDPSGARLIPVLVEAVSDVTHLSRLRQDPRAHAIRMLASYGPRAVTALPVLNAIVSSEKDQRWHAEAAQAIEAIQSLSP